MSIKEYIDRLTKHIAFVIVAVSFIIMGYIIYELAITKQKVAVSLVEKAVNETHYEMEDFFFPVRDQLITAATQIQFKRFYSLDSTTYHELFVPVIKYYEQVSSLGIVDDKGFEYDIIKEKEKNAWKVRIVNEKKYGEREIWAKYHIASNKIFKDSLWYKEAYTDPKERPWYIGVLEKKGLTDVFWTDPYIFNTNSAPGITVSTSWFNIEEDSSRIVLAYDLALGNLSQFTSNLKPTPNGEVMIVTGDTLSVVGLPPKASEQGRLAARKKLLKTAEIPEKELLHIVKHAKDNEPFRFKKEGIQWWGAIKEFKLNDVQSFLIVIALPENDFLREINESQTLMAGGFFGILALTLLILRSHNIQHKHRKLLSKKNDEISKQHKIISEKNKEIMDSITYAKRIQTAILPPTKLVDSYLNDTFILYIPKDIVAGDFYWMHSLPASDTQEDDLILFAAADCTGHGVPGAMVSVMCNNALNRCVREFKLVKPNEILDKTRSLVIEEFAKSESKVKDGMDISLCVLNKKKKQVMWSGANNPLWIARKNEQGEVEISETKPDKQPIGFHIEMNPFTLHEKELKDGDIIYIFTDGLQDQFGGPINKKYKVSRMRELFKEFNDQPMSEQRKLIIEEFKAWKGSEEQVDDICIIGAKI